MRSLPLFAGIFAIVWSTCQAESCDLPANGSPHFPKNFSFGVSTAAYQIEGGWNADGKGVSVWDDFVHNYPDKIEDMSNGDVAADSYHLFDNDLEALKELKVNHYRFSISWTRIFPNGDTATKNQKGIDYYNNIIDKLIENNIEPMVTMLHYDLPLEIQKTGGFGNSLIINQFMEYAMKLFEFFGDRVKKWITINEPLILCTHGYGTGEYPPQVKDPGVADYFCVDMILKSHAATYRAYRNTFYEKQRGKIGIAINSPFFFSKSKESNAGIRGVYFHLGLQAHPIFSKTGGYPEVVVRDIGENSRMEGRNVSRLPNHDEHWMKLIKGSADFLGLNHYSSRILERASKPNDNSPSQARDLDSNSIVDPKWINGKSCWLYCVPEGLEGILKFIRDEYDNVEVLVTENGWSDDGEFIDDNRIKFIKSHLQAILNALNDGCNVTGYTYWSLMDNFEWTKGYTEKFGLYAVNMTSPKRERTPKKSASHYRKIIESRKL